MFYTSMQTNPDHARVSTFRQGVTDSLPVVIGYLPIAFAFGLSAVKLGFTPAESLLFSILIYAGASQFVITALLSAGMSLWVSALTIGRLSEIPCLKVETRTGSGVSGSGLLCMDV
jgi:predicted branched-subunit amino acid permease